MKRNTNRFVGGTLLVAARKAAVCIVPAGNLALVPVVEIITDFHYNYTAKRTFVHFP